jgi:hypothetical protein
VTRGPFPSLIGAVAIVAGLAAPARAQTDEIQVYNAEIAEQGVFNLTIHTNFTPDGIKIPAFPGAVTADKSLNGVPEWAYGVKPWFEAGLYMPLYSLDRTTGFGLDGFKLRTLFVVPHAADRKFFYGTNFEFSVNAQRWNTSRFSSEIRPIVGVRLGDVDLIFNPILDTEYNGLKNLDFAPALRVALNLSKVWAVAAEEYDDFGPIHGFLPTGQQVHEIWGVIDRNGKLDVEAGVGAGLTSASDKLTLKLILSFDLNSPKAKSDPPDKTKGF